MPTRIYKDDSFEQTNIPVRECPHCGAHSQLLPMATPRYATLKHNRPRQVAIGFYCSACGEPRFGRALVRGIGDDYAELADGVVEIERAKERFAFTYLPDTVRIEFSEALECYSTDLYNAFAAMCRRTAAASTAALEDPSSSRWRAAYEDIVGIAGIDTPTSRTLRSVLFDPDLRMPQIDPGQSAVLLEIMKDILYQCHVRAAKFRAAMNMRRFFAEEQQNSSTTTDNRRGVTSDSF